MNPHLRLIKNAFNFTHYPQLSNISNCFRCTCAFVCCSRSVFFFGTGTKESPKKKNLIFFWEACLSADVQKLPTGYLTTPSCWLLHTLAHALYITQTAGEQLSEESLFLLNPLPASSPLTSLTSWKTRTGGSTCTEDCDAEIAGGGPNVKLQPLKPIGRPDLEIPPPPP